MAGNLAGTLQLVALVTRETDHCSNSKTCFRTHWASAVYHLSRIRTLLDCRRQSQTQMIAFNLIERERGETRQSGRGWAVFTAQWCMEPKKLDSPGYDITQIQNCGAHGACTTETSSDQAANLRFWPSPSWIIWVISWGHQKKFIDCFTAASFTK